MVIGFRMVCRRINGQLLLNVLLSVWTQILPPKLNVFLKFTLHYCAKLLRIVVNFVQLIYVWLGVTISQILFSSTVECICSSLLLSRVLVISHNSDAAMRLTFSVFIVKIIGLRLVGDTVGIASWCRDPTCGRLFEFSWIGR